MSIEVFKKGTVILGVLSKYDAKFVKNIRSGQNVDISNKDKC